MTTLATAATLVGFAQQNRWVGLLTLPGTDASPSSTSTPQSTPTAEPTTPSPVPPPVGGATTHRLLTDMEPITGAQHLVALRGSPDAATSLGVPCASGSTRDEYREVRYQLARPYDTFEADVVTSGVTDPDAAIEVDVVSGLEVVGKVVTAGNATAPLAADLSDEHEVAVRVLCQRPGGLVILRNASITRSD